MSLKTTCIAARKGASDIVFYMSLQKMAANGYKCTRNSFIIESGVIRYYGAD